MTIACGTGSAARRGNAAYTGETQPLVYNMDIAAGTAFALYTSPMSTAIPTNTTCMTLMFTWTPTGTAGADDWFKIDSIMFSTVEGAAYDRRNIAEVRARCQRYFFKTFAQDTTPAQNVGINTGAFEFLQGGGASSAGVFGGSLQFPVVMRTAPTIVGYNPAAANAEMRSEVAGVDWSSSTYAATARAFNCIGTTGGGTSQGSKSSIHFTASAEL